MTKIEIGGLSHHTITIETDVKTANEECTSLTYVDIPNGPSVTITTHGRPVLVIFTSSILCGGSAHDVLLRILRDDTVVAESKFYGLSIRGGNMHTIDTPSAGTYTYKMQWKVSADQAYTETFPRRLTIIEL